MNYVFLGAFAAFSAVHLYASWKCDKILRAVTKVFLLPTLLGWYLTTVQTPLDIVIAAVATSWLGDVLLIFGTVGFAVGGFSFFISHLCFAAAYCMHVDFSLVPVWLMILAAAVYIAAVALVFRGLIGNVRPKSLYDKLPYHKRDYELLCAVPARDAAVLCNGHNVCRCDKLFRIRFDFVLRPLPERQAV